jgi:glycosyltransferase involved in cell wall biosynthesis
MNITVILCTFNRCTCLAKALGSVAASVLPSSVQWEVLVVDNNSSDRTREVVEGFCYRYPGRFRYLFEGHQGKSYALNAGIREARGDVLVFLDDDATVESLWLHNLTAALSNGEYAGAGGRILPAQTFSPPRWLALDGPYDPGGILYAHLDLGDEPRELDRAPYGTNMAFRKEVFEKYGGFRTDLGPRPGCEIRNEDTEFGRRLMAAGERLRYEPSAVVYHDVSEERVKKDYFLGWWFDYGTSRIRETGMRPAMWGIPRHYFRILKTVGYALPFVLGWTVALDPKWRFYCKCRTWYAAGQAVEIYRMSHGEEAEGGESRKRHNECAVVDVTRGGPRT